MSSSSPVIADSPTFSSIENVLGWPFTTAARVLVSCMSRQSIEKSATFVSIRLSALSDFKPISKLVALSSSTSRSSAGRPSSLFTVPGLLPLATFAYTRRFSLGWIFAVSLGRNASKLPDTGEEAPPGVISNVSSLYRASTPTVNVSDTGNSTEPNKEVLSTDSSPL